ncbi:unnamed protein product [Pieris brassicae]|uniref:Uncharacterized protein n=1 Tax=Pieris brassicae TaxID=7116 RepID=A0A9P0TUS8_PIEBR|nr:unnamed protein product [Pieris brassicae]
MAWYFSFLNTAILPPWRPPDPWKITLNTPVGLRNRVPHKPVFRYRTQLHPRPHPRLRKRFSNLKLL